MSAEREAGVLFLTAPPGLGQEIAAAVKSRFPEVDWTVYFRVSQRDALGSALDGCDGQSDKPSGSKLEFIREIRRRRYATAVVAWTRHRDYDRMKLVALLSGARRFLIYNENLDSFYLSSGNPSWLAHAQWRLSIGRGVSPMLLAMLVGIYKWTAGLLLGAGWLGARLFLWRVRWHLHARSSTP